jgi:hypothetical protein
MYRIAAATLMVATLGNSAYAHTVPDPKAWAQQFAAVAASGDKAAELAALVAVADPDIKPEAMQHVVDLVDRFNEGHKAQSSSIIRETPLGDMLYRFHLAVHYSGYHYFFWLVDMVHVDDGWELINVDVGSNLNEILSKPWPLK